MEKCEHLSHTRLDEGELAIWQRRFWEHTIRDGPDYAAHVDYVHINPVKHGLVGTVREWSHSQFHRWVERGLYPADWGDVDASGLQTGERHGRSFE